jgi:hypothetical protein
LTYVRAYGKVEELPRYRILWLSKLVYSSPFELFIGFIILVNAFSLAFLTMPGISPQARNTALQFDQIAFSIYLFELALRIIS